MLLFEVKVIPSAGRTGCVIDRSGMLKCALKSPAENNKANEELIKLIARAVGAQQHQVHIVTGLTSRKKRVAIGTNITYAQLLLALGIEEQQKQMPGANQGAG